MDTIIFCIIGVFFSPLFLSLSSNGGCFVRISVIFLTRISFTSRSGPYSPRKSSDDSPCCIRVGQTAVCCLLASREWAAMTLDLLRLCIRDFFPYRTTNRQGMERGGIGTETRVVLWYDLPLAAVMTFQHFRHSLFSFILKTLSLSPPPLGTKAMPSFTAMACATWVMGKGRWFKTGERSVWGRWERG